MESFLSLLVAHLHSRLDFSISGGYPPQVKLYELRELALKFDRRCDAEIVQFQVILVPPSHSPSHVSSQILSDDYSKMAFLRADRQLEFHARFGGYFNTRLPRVLPPPSPSPSPSPSLAPFPSPSPLLLALLF